MSYMLKRRKTADIYIVVAISLFASILSGCQKKDVRTLQDPSGAHTVTDYSAFSDADVKVQTERETENHVKDLIVKSKISYVEKGQTIDLSDLSVTAEMADGTTKTVKNAKVSVFDIGDKCSVTVLYEGVSGSVSIPVKAPETETEELDDSGVTLETAPSIAPVTEGEYPQEAPETAPTLTPETSSPDYETAPPVPEDFD